MHTRILTSLYVYPIKSLGGIALQEAVPEQRGLQYDRRWMLVDEQGRFVSQREVAELALLGTAIEPPHLVVFSKKNPALRVQVPLSPPVEAMPEITAEIWNDRCPAREYGLEVNGWFSSLLGCPLRLVYMPDTAWRPTDPAYVPEGIPVSFADGYPYLLIGEATIDDLNARLEQPVPMNRFRPNFVFSGSAAYEEDEWRDFTIGTVRFRGIKPCARCIVPTTDQDTALRAAEPLKTLATYRKEGHRILFGQNTVWVGAPGDVVRVGDTVNP
ncbi:MAG: MOSC N-terminal beta barrel domain-containing protein [Saprospiraceae bacterium]